MYIKFLCCLDWLKFILDNVGYISTIIVLLTAIIVLYKKIIINFKIFNRIGKGFINRKIAIYADITWGTEIKEVLTQTYFNYKNIYIFSNWKNYLINDATLLIINFNDFKKNLNTNSDENYIKNELDKFIQLRKGNAQIPIIIFAQTSQDIPRNIYNSLTEQINITVVNAKGRLVNDIVTYIITTSIK